MRECRHCEGWIEDSFRFCPWCAAPQRRKIVEFFPAPSGRDRLRRVAALVLRR